MVSETKHDCNFKSFVAALVFEPVTKKSQFLNWTDELYFYDFVFADMVQTVQAKSHIMSAVKTAHSKLL